jgi:inositol-pentakisphosphate 2-kinase
MVERDNFLAKVFATNTGQVKLFCALVDENDFENGIETLVVSSIVPKESQNVDNIPLIVRIGFLAEGAANVLFEVTPESNHVGAPLEVQNIVNSYLLRLRKKAFSPGSIAPPYVSAAKLCHFIETEIKPSIPSRVLVDHLRVAYSERFLDKCNAVMMEMERNGTRDPKRHGAYFDDGSTRVGLLVENMMPKSDNAMLLEFKAKWLHQSPGAPENSRRCRTCAWHIKYDVHRSKRYCPLAFISGESELLIDQLKRLPHLWKGLPETWNVGEVIEELADYLSDPDRGHGLLDLVGQRQKQLDPHGILKLVPVSAANPSRNATEAFQSVVHNAIVENQPQLIRLSQAMTLRDCTVFIRISRSDSGSYTIEAKLGDLDPKPPDEGKVLKWAEDELSLIVDGYYEGIEAVETHGYNESEMEEVCMLWKRS